ncbi:MAG: FG-GAP-like repeat-containing protein, partial [Planctomycetota bacterium]|nr:FG-GAP-like repeat-containing protein [Planctomycetota bacterium]
MSERTWRFPRSPVAAWLTTLGLVAVLAPFPGRLAAQAGELIDTARLGQHGVAFESPVERFFSLVNAVGIGDFDGDGFDDVVLGMDETSFDPQVAVLIHGRPRLTSTHVLDGTLPGVTTFRVRDLEEPGGLRVAPAGDLDGDGLADFVLSYSRYVPRGESRGQGASFLVYGTREPLGDVFVEDVGGAVRGSVFFSSDTSERFTAYNYTTIGDFDGDGTADIVVGSISLSGVARVILDATDLPAQVDLARVRQERPVLEIRRGGGLSGGSLLPAGDFDGDGRDDLLVLVRGAGTLRAVYLVLGRADPAGILSLPAADEDPGAHGVVIFRGPSTDLLFAERFQAAGVGDIDGDGFDDVAVGMSRSGVAFPGDGPVNSVVHLFYGAPDFPAEVSFDDVPAGLSTAIRPRHDGSVGDAFGKLVAGPGDVNGDGVPDIVIGAPEASLGGRTRVGEAYVIYGGRRLGDQLSLADGFDGIRLLGDGTNNGLGLYGAPAGDFDGDGALDVVITGPQLTSATAGGGRAILVYGRADGEVPFDLLSVHPGSGAVRGGTRVTLRGSGFRHSPQVSFGGRPARAVSLLSGSELSAVAPPAGQPGVVDVVVTIEAESRRLDSAFEYTPDLPEFDLARPGRRGFRLDGVPGSEIGHSLAFGDVDGDGVDDLLVASREGSGWVVSIVLGGAGLPDRLPAFESSSRVRLVSRPQAPGITGVHVAALGDVDGDGVGDVGVASTDAVGFILFGRGELPPETDIDAEVLRGAAVRLEPDPATTSYSRFTFVPLGDITGDQVDDFAVALSQDTRGVAGLPGKILFLEGRERWPGRVDLSAPATAFATVVGLDTGFAQQAVRVGDADGDGFPELLVNSSPGADVARTYLLSTGREMPREADVESYLASVGGTVIDRVGREAAFVSFLNVAMAGDVDGDGYSDFLLGDELAGELQQGITFVLRGGADLPAFVELEESPVAPDGVVRVLGAAQQVQSGRAVGPAGDFNVDGFADIVVGAQSGSDPFDPGNLSVVFGGPEMPSRIELRALG